MGWDLNIKFTDVCDIGIIAIVLYIVFVWFEKTRAAFVLIGLAIAGGLYLLARQFNLLLTTQIFQSVLAVVLIGVIVIFQQEIRYFFEQVAIWSLNRKLGKKYATHLPTHEVEVLVKTLFDLAAEKIGALIAIRGKDILAGYVDGGIELHGKLSEHILKSIFDSHSIGHDGAVIIEGDKLTHLAAHLPLSKDSGKLGYGGTRHAAALGLSEVTDALCLVVSEERGSVSYARGGEIRRVQDPRELAKILEQLYDEIHPAREKVTWFDYFRKNSREKVIAVLMASALWFVQVYSAELIYENIDVPVIIENVPKQLTVAAMNSDHVKASFSAPRRRFYWMKEGSVRLTLNAAEWKKGERSVRLVDSDLSFPEGLVLRSISPRDVKVRLDPISSAKAKD
ncbi:MAG: diadenylate cyclase [Candidatus Omnitrophota bacterium]|nr:diadenylate cyclase [Candidatus Omnitrophota bacterium]